MTIDETICDLKMNALTEKLGLMLQPITDGIKRIEKEVGELKSASSEFVSLAVFQEKCREIEGIKRFVWSVSGALSVISFVLGLAVKFLK